MPTSSASQPGTAALPPASSLDPRLVPIVSEAQPLPAVARSAQTVQALRQRFTQPPVWQPEVWQEPRWMERPLVPASVLIPLVMRDELMVLLTQRTAHLSSHSGQVAFPGGKQDPQDRDAVAAALREAQEEVGLQSQHVEVLGTLPVYVTGSAYTITPVVALVQAHAPLRPNPDEVADVFEVPLPFLLDPANHRRHRWQQREWFSMPFDDAGTERYIWGATAGMLRNLYRFMQA